MIRASRSQTFPVRAALTAAALLALFALAACGKPKPEYVVPEFETAGEQYGFAESQRQKTTASSVSERRKEQMESIVVLYAKVVERFPEDRVYTPQAKLKLAMLNMRMPGMDAKRNAIEILEECVQQHDDFEEVHANALYQLGVALDIVGDYERAQNRYREVFDRYGASENAQLKEVAKKARSNYNKVRTRSGGGR